MDNAMRLNVFVTNILDAAKIKAGRMEYHLRPVDLDAVARGVQTLFSIVAKKRRILEDTGSGISENLAGLFQRFRQVDAAGQRARSIQGTGLGLVIVKQTVEGMGGRITATSEVGKGSRFAVILPVEEKSHAVS